YAGNAYQATTAPTSHRTDERLESGDRGHEIRGDDGLEHGIVFELGGKRSGAYAGTCHDDIDVSLLEEVAGCRMQRLTVSNIGNVYPMVLSVQVGFQGKQRLAAPPKQSHLCALSGIKRSERGAYAA